MTEIPSSSPLSTASPADGERAAMPNLPEYTVSEISQAVRRVLEGEFDYVRVRGEISGFKKAASGHLYFSLKDEKAVLSAVCWRGTAGRLAVSPEDGLEVVCSGRVTSYPGRSQYQIVVDGIELAGQGALLKMLEERRRRLAEEGLFDEARKKPLPYLPRSIGVITSPTGAVIRDILHRLNDRFPLPVTIWPVLVQGEGAAKQVAAAISGFNALPEGEGEGAPAPFGLRPDLLIVARGGGSLEDLMAFNDEAVVRAVAASAIPLISAVGHETDTTLIDFAADRRAPTPTAAAEMAVPVRAELVARVQEGERRLLGAATRFFDRRRERLLGLARGLPDPRAMLENAMQRLDGGGERLSLGLGRYLADRGHGLERIGDLARPLRTLLLQKEARLGQSAGRLRSKAFSDEITRGHRETSRLAAAASAAVKRRLALGGDQLRQLSRLLEGVSFERVLERGFVLVHDTDGRPVTQAAQAEPGADLGLRFADGDVPVRVTGGARPAVALVRGAGGSEKEKPPPRKKPDNKKPDTKDRQGKLL